MSARRSGRATDRNRISLRVCAAVACALLAMAIAIAGASPALAASYRGDGSGADRDHAKALAIGEKAVGTIENEGLFVATEWHYYKFKTSSRDSVYAFRLRAIDGRDVCLAYKWYPEVRANSLAGKLSDPITDLPKNELQYFRVYGGSDTRKYDQFEVSVLEYPILRGGSVSSHKAYTRSARVYFRKEANATAYQVKYRSQNAKGKWSSWKLKTTKARSLKLTGLARGKQVQVKVRPYRKGGWDWSNNKKSNYGSWSPTTTFRTKK